MDVFVYITMVWHSAFHAYDVWSDVAPAQLGTKLDLEWHFHAEYKWDTATALTLKY